METTEPKSFHKPCSTWVGLRNNSYPLIMVRFLLLSLINFSIGHHSKVRKDLMLDLLHWCLQTFHQSPSSSVPQETLWIALLRLASPWLWLDLVNGKHQQKNTTWDLAPCLSATMDGSIPFWRPQLLPGALRQLCLLMSPIIPLSDLPTPLQIVPPLSSSLLPVWVCHLFPAWTVTDLWVWVIQI